MMLHRYPRLAAALLATLLTASLASGAQAATRTENLGVLGGAVTGAAVGGPVGMLVGAALGGHYGHQRQRAADGERGAAELAGELARVQRSEDAARAELERLTERVAFLSDQLSDGQARIATLLDEQALLAELQLQVLFRTDDDTLTDADKARLLTLGKVLDNNPALRVRLSGYADPRGSDAHNDALSMRRAQAAAAVLTGAQVDPGRIDTVAFGARQAATDGKDPHSLARERRVDVELLRTPSASETLARATTDD